MKYIICGICWDPGCIIKQDDKITDRLTLFGHSTENYITESTNSQKNNNIFSIHL